MNLKRRLTTIASTTALTAAALGAAVAAPASAATAPNGPGDGTGTLVASASATTAAGWTSLYIYDFNDGNYWVTVEGKGSIKKFVKDNMSIQLWGDDQFFDELEWTEWPLTTNADGSYYVEFPVCCGALNEDWGRDEIYARVSVYDGVGHSAITYSSNFNGDF